jgi:hypothetical protein
MNPVREEGMPERLGRRDTPVRVERQASFQKLDELVELPLLSIRHAARRGQQPGPQIARRLDGA